MHTTMALPLRSMLYVRWDGAPYCFQRRNCMRLGGMGIEERPTDMPSLQAAASVGPCNCTYKHSRSTMCLPHACLSLDTLRRSAMPICMRVTPLRRLIDFDVVPIINENDTVSVEQIRFGDNDTCRPRLFAWCGRYVRYLLRYRRLVYR